MIAHSDKGQNLEGLVIINQSKNKIKMGEMTQEEKEKLYTRLDKVDANISRVLFILENDDKISNKGLVQIVRENSKNIEDIVVERKLERRTIAVIGLAGGAMWQLLQYLIKIFFER